MRSHTQLTVAAALVVAVAGFTPPAAAAPPGTGPAAAVSAAATATESAATVQEAVSAYWTPERMAAAIPAEELAPEPTGQGAGTIEAGPAGSIPPAAPVTPGRADRARPTTAGKLAAVNASATVGKVFFSNPGDGRNYVCSASAVNGSAKNLVSTAGHCVYDPEHDNWMQNWQFVPYYNYGNRPYGTWYAAQLTTFNGWVNDGDYDWDVAFVNVWQNNGRLVDRVGGNGLIYNYPKDVAITLLAYPAEAPFDGEWQYYCEGNIYERWFTDQVGFDCLMTGGSSGGPFFYGYDNSSTLGYVDGVISNGPDETSYSPYFDTDVANLYFLVEGYTT